MSYVDCIDPGIDNNMLWRDVNRLLLSTFEMNKIVAVVTSVLVQIVKKMKEAIIDDKFFSNLKILVVDDNDLINNFVKRLLERHKMEVFQAYNGIEAMEKITSHEFDIVITDFNMPLMDGLELISEIRTSEDEHLALLPVLCLSSEESPLVINRIINAGANKFISKPFVPSELLNTIGELMVQYPQQEQIRKFKLNFAI